MSVQLQELIKPAILASAILALATCEKSIIECPDAVEKDFVVANFTRVEFGEAFRATITRGASFALHAEGCSDDLDDLEVRVNDGALVVRFRNYWRDRNRVDLAITLPNLEGFEISGAANVIIEGFDQSSTVNGQVSGASFVTFSGNAAQFVASLSGASRLELDGLTYELDAHLSGDSRLRAYSFNAAEADVDVSGNAQAWVLAKQTLQAHASGNGRIYYRGNPQMTVSTSGNGKVAKE